MSTTKRITGLCKRLRHGIDGNFAAAYRSLDPDRARFAGALAASSAVLDRGLVGGRGGDFARPLGQFRPRRLFLGHTARRGTRARVSSRVCADPFGVDALAFADPKGI